MPTFTTRRPRPTRQAQNARQPPDITQPPIGVGPKAPSQPRHADQQAQSADYVGVQRTKDLISMVIPEAEERDPAKWCGFRLMGASEPTWLQRWQILDQQEWPPLPDDLAWDLKDYMRNNVSFFGPPLGSTIAAASVSQLPLVAHNRGCRCVFCRLSTRVVLDYPLVFPYLSDEAGRDGVRRAFGVTRLPDDTAVRGPPGSQECRYSILTALQWMAGQEERDLQWRRDEFLGPGERTCEDLEINFAEAFAPLDIPPCARHRPPADTRVPVHTASAQAIARPSAPDSPTTPPGFEVLPPHQSQPDASSHSDGPTVNQCPPRAMDGNGPALASHVPWAVPYPVPHPPLLPVDVTPALTLPGPVMAPPPAEAQYAPVYGGSASMHMPHVGPQPMPVQPVAEVVPPLLGFLDQPHEGVIVRPVEAMVQAPAGQRGPHQEMALGHPGILPDFTPQPPNGYVLSHLDFLEPYTVQAACDLQLSASCRHSSARTWDGVPMRPFPAAHGGHSSHFPLGFAAFWPKRRVYEAGASVRPHVPVQHPMLSPTYGLALVEALTPDLCASARAGQLRLLVHEGALRDLMLRVMMATFLSDFKSGYVNLGQQSLTLTQPYYLYGFWGLWPPGTWRDCLLDAGRIEEKKIAIQRDYQRDLEGARGVYLV
eukprot:jgi/Mesvir1/839/Mv17417-RA.1